jgi:energy-converting hydrogenase Eha subunit F
MDRVGGAYKRMTQLITFLIALGVAVALNIDAIQVTEALWARPLLAKSIDAKYPDVGRAVADLDQLGLPIGWKAPPTASSQGSRPGLVTVLGWLITAIATRFSGFLPIAPIYRRERPIC